MVSLPPLLLKRSVCVCKHVYKDTQPTRSSLESASFLERFLGQFEESDKKVILSSFGISLIAQSRGILGVS